MPCPSAGRAREVIRADRGEREAPIGRAHDGADDERLGMVIHDESRRAASRARSITCRCMCAIGSVSASDLDWLNIRRSSS